MQAALLTVATVPCKQSLTKLRTPDTSGTMQSFRQDNAQQGIQLCQYGYARVVYTNAFVPCNSGVC